MKKICKRASLFGSAIVQVIGADKLIESSLNCEPQITAECAQNIFCT